MCTGRVVVVVVTQVTTHQSQHKYNSHIYPRKGFSEVNRSKKGRGGGGGSRDPTSLLIDNGVLTRYVAFGPRRHGACARSYGDRTNRVL